MKFLGCLDDVTEGILAGRWDGGEWVRGVSNSFIPHGCVSKDAGCPAAVNQEEQEGGEPWPTPRPAGSQEEQEGGESWPTPRPAGGEPWPTSRPAISQEQAALPRYAQDAMLDYATDGNSVQEESPGYEVPQLAISPETT